MRSIWTLMVAAVALVGLGAANAHPHPYVNVTGDQLSDCDVDGVACNTATCKDAVELGVSDLSQGGRCFPPGHVGANALGVGFVTIVDTVNSPTSGFACQDTNVNNICGEPGEIGTVFCNTVLLQSGVNWSPAISTLVWVDGPVNGNPAISPCGSLSVAVMGDFNHS